ncbi:MAG: acyltransferase, partial [Intestinibacter sp.]|uniref:acyltransferase n=1 Tax=Intestinibacter sp. TaxID=1965304 RepID=UPI003F14C1CA
YIGKKMIETGPLYLKVIENGKINIGKNVFFNHNCSITSIDSILIDDDCFFGNNVVIVDHDHLIDDGVVHADKLVASKVKIGKKSWIGANCVITRGVTIGDNVVIAAGAVVTRDIPDNEVWGGVPAKKIKNMKNNEDN